MLETPKNNLQPESQMFQKMSAFGVSPKEFIRAVATLPEVQLGKGLPPTTDKILDILIDREKQGTLTEAQAGLLRNLDHLRFNGQFQKLLSVRIAQKQQPISFSVCCPTMPRDTLSENSNIVAIGKKVGEAAQLLSDSYHQVSTPNRNGLFMKIFATPNYPGVDFKSAQDQSALNLERERLGAYTNADLSKGKIGELEFVYPNHREFFKLWDDLGLPELKQSGKGTSMFVASIAVLARQFREGLSEQNGFYTSMDTDLKLPSAAYLGGFMHSALNDCVASIASFFRINSSGVETGRLNAIMTPFIEAIDDVLGEKLGVISHVLKQINYQLSGERQFRTDVLKTVPIGCGYFDETSKNLEMARMVRDGEISIDRISNVLIGTYAHHNQPASAQELEDQGLKVGRTLEDMAREIFRGFFQTVIGELGVPISETEARHIRDITLAKGALMITRKKDLAKQVGLTPPNTQALRELLDFSCSLIISEHQAVKSDIFNQTLSPTPRLTLEQVLNRGMHPDDLYGRVNDILDRSKVGIAVDDIVPFKTPCK